MMYPYLKRVLDLFFVLLFIALTLPVWILIPLIIFLQDGHNPIFKQRRVGRNGKEFYFYKFRSMPISTPNVESTEKDKIKITPFGKILRLSNFDEITQIFNIIKGEMSWIGPRPPIPTQTNLIKLRKENKSLDLRPGITGWAQVHSYDNMPEEEKAKLDGEYAEKLSLYTDMLVFFKTFAYMFKKSPTY